MRALTELTDQELADAVAELGGKPFQVRQVSHWLWKHGVTAIDAMQNVPTRLREGLAARFRVRAGELAQVDEAEDGTQ